LDTSVRNSEKERRKARNEEVKMKIKQKKSFISKGAKINYGTRRIWL
jgi:hypothetical protein